MDPLRLEWPPCLVPLAPAPDVHRRVKKALGFVPRSVEYTGCVPWVSEIDRLVIVPPVTRLGNEVAEMAILAAAHATTCRHCYGATRAAMRLLGYSEERVRALSDHMYAEDVGPEVRAAAELVRAVVSLEVSKNDFDRATAAGFGPEEVAELVLLASLATTYSRLNTPLAVPHDGIEALQKSFFSGMISIFFRRGVASKKAAWLARRSTAAEIGGPFESLLGPLVPGPAAAELRALIDACLASEVCPHRTKLVAMAIVARAADAGELEAELRTLAADAGVGDVEYERAVKSLASDDAFERLLLELARDSPRYRPGDIQRRAAALADGHPPARVVDAIATVAVANGLARLATLRLR